MSLELGKYDLCVFLDRRAYEWAILPDDIHVQRRNNLNRNRNLRCINCREEGHRMQDCFMPPKQMICHMCGQTGHREPRCPQTMCLRVNIISNQYNPSSQNFLNLCSVAIKIVYLVGVANAVIICKVRSVLFAKREAMSAEIVLTNGDVIIPP